MLPRSSGLLLALWLGLAGGCASAGSGYRTTTSRDVLTREQLEQVHATNAYEAVERLRSRWMRGRGTTQMPSVNGAPQFEENQVVVYLDDHRMGTVDQLRQIEISAVQYIRYYSPTEASARWGLNHGGGAIFVSTRPPEWTLEK